MRPTFFVLISLFGAALGACAQAPGAPSLFIRGVTVSCQTSGVEWGRPEMADSLDELHAMGAGWVAIHPYARIAADGSLRFSTEAQPPQLVRPLAWAKARGLGVMIVPHIAYWGSPFSWRGAIDFEEPACWDRFFADYERWIVPLARLAEEGGAGLFCLGLEYSHAEKFEARWRHVIGAVRAVYHGRITYGANWGDVESVPFWDALDLIGVLAYFPLSTEAYPSAVALEKGWQPWLAKLGALSKKFDKPVLFTEVGYDAACQCAARPWESGRDVQERDVALQMRCLRRALSLENHRLPWLAGLFLWKWFPGGAAFPHHESFDLRAAGPRQVLAESWSRPQARPEH